MSKLYVFGIGGTGSRVLKSLTLLLASGVKCKDTIVPIVVDRDIANGDLERTRDIINNYIKVNTYSPIKNAENENYFFNTKIELLDDRLELQLKDETSQFKDYIDWGGMSLNNRALTNMLFSEETLNMDMTVGFQGNPNVGSVVLNQFESTDMFDSFGNAFNEGDKIFIISSIFGGTGASGFPLLLKTLNKPIPNYAKWGQVQNAPKGAISVLPYFDVEEDTTGKSLVRSSTFIDKTKAALSYYKSLDKQIDALYYIADKERSSLEHNAGGRNQVNQSNFIELSAALSVIDFSNNTNGLLSRNKNDNQKIEKTTYKEFGLMPSKSNSRINVWSEISFSDMGITNSIIRTPMIQFFVFRKYLKEVYNKERKYQPYSYTSFDNLFLSSEKMTPLINILDTYYTWLIEMKWLEKDKVKQSRSFAPFNLTSRNKNVFEFIEDKQNYRKGSFSYRNWAWFDNELNKQINNVNDSLLNEEKFIELFYRTTKVFVTDVLDGKVN